MADHDNESLGIRLYEVHKGQDVEKSLGVFRSIHRGFWVGLDDKDIQRLRWSLGEAWGLLGQRKWDSLIFADMSWEQVIDLVDIARDVEMGKIDATLGAQRAEKVLLAE